MFQLMAVLCLPGRAELPSTTLLPGSACLACPCSCLPSPAALTLSGWLTTCSCFSHLKNKTNPPAPVSRQLLPVSLSSPQLDPLKGPSVVMASSCSLPSPSTPGRLLPPGTKGLHVANTMVSSVFISFQQTRPPSVSPHLPLEALCSLTSKIPCILWFLLPPWLPLPAVPLPSIRSEHGAI